VNPPLSPDALQRAARIALRCLDLTRLNDADTAADIERLCVRAQGAHGAVAAVCVWPRFAALARGLLPARIAVAAVANFPEGGNDAEATLHEVRQIVDAGAQELDVVLPYRALLAGDDASATAVLRSVRAACKGHLLKVILETGELRDDAAIVHAARLALANGADFLKTSTGKTPVSATPRAFELMLQVIADDPLARDRVGVKASGGIRSVADAAPYIALCDRAFGAGGLDPARLRFGASGLLDDIEAVLGGAGIAESNDGY
jgi:deoxyribose-phosphate aldolase